MCSNIAEHVGPAPRILRKKYLQSLRQKPRYSWTEKTRAFQMHIWEGAEASLQKTLMFVQPSAGPLLYTLGAIPDTDKGRWKEDLQCHSTVGVCSRKQREHQDVSRLQMAIAVQARSVTKPLLVNSSLQVTLNSTSAQHLWCWKQKIVDSKPDPKERRGSL